MQNLGGEALLFAQQSQQQVLGADMLVIEPLGFLGAIGQHAFAFVAQREIHGGRNLLSNGGVPFDLLAYGIHRRMGPQEAVGQRLILAKQTQEQMLGFDIRASELAGLIPREKDYSASFLRVPFKHRPYRFPLL